MSNNGFVSDYNDGQIIYGLHEDWRIEVANKGARPGFINATPDSRVFHHNFHPEDRTIAVDVYLHGKLVGTVGPYPSYRGGNATLCPDGNAALLARDPLDDSIQIIVFDENAEVRFVSRSDEPIMGPVVTPNADGVLVEANTGERPQRFIFHQTNGTSRSLTISPNARVLDWVPGTHNAVFETSLGHEGRYRLIDWDTGETLWEIANPCPRVNAVARSVAALQEYVITCGYEYSGSEHPVTIPTLYAIGARMGEVAARWRPNFGSIVSVDGGRLLNLRDGLYFVSEDRVSEIKMDEIRARTNGWE